MKNYLRDYYTFHISSSNHAHPPPFNSSLKQYIGNSENLMNKLSEYHKVFVSFYLQRETKTNLTS